MKIKHLPVAISVFFTLSGSSWAATPGAPDTIRFEGAIVERSCSSGLSTQATVKLNTCPALGRATVVNVRNVDPLSASAQVTVKLLADSGQGRYYDQRYALVDATGAPVRSGNYLMTMTLP
ncbi:type 1 fimbrial protein [Pseudomonas sp. G(2018)]|uniref:type 1 fimbrial protein n=1 Tax=Pseudomonas sp. G(2018) TaxID=2502242 RepID=UPI0010F5D1BE|nr:type 1 fimbrial protein [Pseudomonas sp. G(2018)]